MGDENMFLFGMTADEVQALWQRGYDPRQFLTPELDRVLQMLTSGVLGQRFDDVAASLLTPRFGAADSYMTVADFASSRLPRRTRSRSIRTAPALQRCPSQTSQRAGIFSSDRSVEQYAREIWDL
ncbi:MAG: glycogen/starch/alpha-glucan phosphorylase [Acutalibacteraceae bacterium]